MKYVIIKDQRGRELPVIFPDSIVHSDMAEYTGHLLAMQHNSFDNTVVAAGFCNIPHANCFGESESLLAGSRDTDSLVLSYSDSLSGMPIDELPETVLAAIKEHHKAGLS